MENLNKNAIFTYEDDSNQFTINGSKDITKDKISSIGVKAREALGNIYQDEHGKYKVEFTKGYTQYGRNYRLARTNAEIGFVLMGAREEKEAIGKGEVRDMTYYMESFKKNGIHTNGNEIPTFIDTEKDFKAKAEKKLAKETKKEVKTKEDKPKEEKSK